MGRRPSGTRATVTPTANRNPSEAWVPTSTATAKNASPTPTAIGRDGPHDAVELDRQGAGGAAPGLGEAGDARQTGGRADRRDAAEALALDHERAREDGRTRLHHLRHALPRHRGGVDPEPVGLQHLEVGRDAVARAEDDDITHDQLFGIDHRGKAVTANGGPPGQQPSQLLGCPVGLVLLREREDAVDDDDDDDGDRQLGQPGQPGQSGRHPQHDGEEVDELGAEPLPDGDARWLGQPVGAVAREPGAGLLRGQPGAQVDSRAHVAHDPHGLVRRHERAEEKVPAWRLSGCRTRRTFGPDLGQPRGGCCPWRPSGVARPDRDRGGAP